MTTLDKYRILSTQIEVLCPHGPAPLLIHPSRRGRARTLDTTHPDAGLASTVW
ncbi:hypothetical protein SEA_BEGONIA_77 [Gordonia phage Begonia]|nr:hypothetical protein SEA_BEGONIA_77 [Gordonia phage Begonia]